jgi:hypothetical protein
MASVQGLELAARSALSQVSWADPSNALDSLTVESLTFSTMMCQFPRSRL